MMKTTYWRFNLLSGAGSSRMIREGTKYSEQAYTTQGSDDFASFVALLGVVDQAVVDKLIAAFSSVVTLDEFTAALPAFSDYIADLTTEKVETVTDADLGEVETRKPPKVVFTGRTLTLEQCRAKLLARLNTWWDDTLGIGVLPGIVLPIDKASIGAMAAAANVSAQMGVDLSLDDVNDKTVIIPAAQIQTAIGTFYVKLNEMRAKWDTLLAQIESAKTIEELAAITIG